MTVDASIQNSLTSFSFESVALEMQLPTQSTDAGLSSESIDSSDPGDFMKQLQKQLAETVLDQIEEFKKEATELLAGIQSKPRMTAFREIFYQEKTLTLDYQIQLENNAGRRIDIDLEINLKQSFLMQAGIDGARTQSLMSAERSSSSSSSGFLIDPLVIKMGEGDLELSEKSFSFDLDADGEEDQIAMLQRDSGFLALDYNENGVIDDGNELFGPKTGDGFAELARYDSNNDQVIDEQDSIYDKLRLWKKNDTGEDELVALGQAGIGAIHLDTQKRTIDLMSSSGDLLGRETESASVEAEGTTASIHHVDFAKLGDNNYENANSPETIRDYLIANATDPTSIHAASPRINPFFHSA